MLTAKGYPLVQYCLYTRDQKWSLKTAYTTAANRYTLVSPQYLVFELNGTMCALESKVEINLSVAANWDTVAGTDYTVAANRAGKNFYIYAVGGNIDKAYVQTIAAPAQFIISSNSTFPVGYTASGSRKIGGFHCLCAGVGTIGSHTLTGFLGGDVLPQTIWDLLHKPKYASPEGMFFSEGANIWVDIYPASGTGANTASAFGASTSDNRTWLDFVDDGGSVRKRMLKDREFQIIAAGSNEETNIYGSIDAITTGKTATNTFSGSGLNDCTLNASAHTLGVNGAQEYEVEIDATGTPDTFKWRQRDFAGAYGEYTNTVAIVAGAMALANGITVTFAATTGHTVGGKWTLRVANGNRDTANRRMISNDGAEECCGFLDQWLDEQSYRCDPDGTVTAAAQTFTITYAASPGGNPVYLRMGDNGIYYLACNMATAAVDKYVGPANYKVVIRHEAGAATGAIGQVYFDADATNGYERFLVNIATITKNVFIPTNNPAYLLEIKHDASAATNGTALRYDDGADMRLESASSPTADATQDLVLNSQGFADYDLPGSKGSLYRQGTNGDVKLRAGRFWANGTACGSRGRAAANSRWYTHTALGCRFCAEPV